MERNTSDNGKKITNILNKKTKAINPESINDFIKILEVL
jgi:hypothetical protein